ncbi:hypothetical protein [Miniimonas arenae]|uniref:hypothetical protein n=1 Tax=Miniimonas arenae TaxID=676201 RepID=UPI0015D57B06|nr:hypothetical protein [Miniimonas arenae]
MTSGRDEHETEILPATRDEASGPDRAGAVGDLETGAVASATSPETSPEAAAEAAPDAGAGAGTEAATAQTTPAQPTPAQPTPAAPAPTQVPDAEPAPARAAEPVAEPLTRAEAVARAVRQWQDALSALGGESALRDIDTVADATLDLSAAHPGGMAQLLAGRPTALGNLVREPSALAHARRRARVVLARAAEHRHQYGVTATTAALGVIAWSEPGEDGARVDVRAPVFLRPVALEMADGDLEPTLTLGGRAQLNPVVEHALLHAGLDPAVLVAPVLEGSSDLREALDGIRDAAVGALEEPEVSELIVVGSFAHPGQLLADDLAGGWLAGHDVVAALAGDRDAIRALAVEPPPALTRDRDPGTERGVGDLDLAQQRVLDTVASGLSVVVDAPPGTPTTETVAAIVADAAASGRTVLHVPGTRRAGESLVARMIELGLDGMVLDAADGPAQGPSAGGLLVARLGADLPTVDKVGIGAQRAELTRLRAALTARVDAWHTRHHQLGVSPYDALQALAELTARRPAPRSQVRLSYATLGRLTGRALEDARGELARAAALGAFQVRRSDSPWFGVRLADADQARACVASVQRLAARTLPALRQKIAVATTQTGLEPARDLETWVEQLRMLQGVRAALDVFQPTIFERSAADLVAATAPRSERDAYDEMPAAVRRRLRKQAKDLLRPGRHVTDLHAELVAVQEQREVWQVHCTAGGWPRLPDSMSELIGATEEVTAAISELDAPLRNTVGDGSVPLEHLHLDDLSDHLLSLAEDESVARALPERTDAVARLVDLGLADLLDDLADRRVPLELVTAELDLAWWTSALEHVIASEPALRGASSYAQDVERLRELDRRQVDSLVPPVALATAQALRTVAVAHKATAREVFRLADAARRGIAPLDLRRFRAEYAPVGAQVVPCWSVPAMLVPQLLERPGAEPDGPPVDLVVLDSVQNLATEQAVSAIARARQVVLVGDVRRGGTGLVADLAAVLPRVELDGSRTDRDEFLTAFLAAHGYEGAVVEVPSPPGPTAIRLDLVEGRALAAHGGVVDSVPAEVEHVVDVVIDHALSRPTESLAVIALNPRHAMRIREAVAAAVTGSPAVAGFFDTGRLEPFQVVDVEQAAGMRRDAVVLAVGYGKTPHGRVIHQFGAVSSARGVSLLVDALEACRRRLVVTSCLAPSELDSTRLRSAGSRMLSDLLQFAAAGGEYGVPPAEREGHPAPLLVDLADRLWKLGLDVVADYGPPRGVRIPLAVGHPSLPGTFQVAVLTDTDDYVMTGSLRARDRYWVERLERRGWAVVVLSSLDVFLDPAAAAQRVLDAVTARVRDALAAPTRTAASAPPVLQVDEDGADDADEPVGLGGVEAGRRGGGDRGTDAGGGESAGSDVGDRAGAGSGGPADGAGAGEALVDVTRLDGAAEAVDPAETEDEASEAPPRQGERPDVFAGLPMGAYSVRELDALAAWIMSDGLGRDDAELAAQLRAELAVPRGAARADEIIGEVVERTLRPRPEEPAADDHDDVGDTAAERETRYSAGPETAEMIVRFSDDDAADDDAASADSTAADARGGDSADSTAADARGGDSADARGGTEPGATAQRASAAARPPAPAVLPSKAWEDEDRAWGDRGGDDEDRLRRERPPHWG